MKTRQNKIHRNPKSKGTITDVWLKASVLGSIWAASEIIIGSFLHNLRIPFVGIVLAGIGLILLISAAHVWKEKGLFWRAGLICALMKTISPSALIFGPMIAIFMEALIFEISVRLAGRNIAGYLIGSALAMSWILVHQVINLIILYGFNIVDIYYQLMKYAESQLGIDFEIVWLPVIILLGIYMLFGFAAASIGMMSGRMLISDKNMHHEAFDNREIPVLNSKNTDFPFSVVWLIANIILLPSMMLLISTGPLILWFAATIAVISVWWIRYENRLSQLLKPQFWILFIFITMLAAITVTYIQQGNGDIQKGILLGLKMNFRAAVVIAGFAALGTELYNPAIRRFFIRMGFSQLPQALELAFESLPDVVRSLPSNSALMKKPFLLMRQLFNLAEKRFEELKRNNKSRVFILTGDIDSGKSTFVKELTQLLKQKGLSLAGFYSEKLMQSTKLSGYDMINIKTGERIDFLRTDSAENSGLVENKNTDPICSHKHKSRFMINAAAIQKGVLWLDHGNIAGTDLVVIDEIGKWELEGNAWARSLDQLLSKSENDLLLVVRDRFLDEVVSKWDLEEAVIINIMTTNPVDCAKMIAIP